MIKNVCQGFFVKVEKNLRFTITRNIITNTTIENVGAVIFTSDKMRFKITFNTYLDKSELIDIYGEIIEKKPQKILLFNSPGLLYEELECFEKIGNRIYFNGFITDVNIKTITNNAYEAEVTVEHVPN